MADTVQAASHHGSTLIPSLRYRDANAAIEFLERVFGFARHAYYPGKDNTVEHAELRHGTGMVMLGSASNPNRQNWIAPTEAGGRVTSPLYIVVPDCSPVWERVKAAEAEVIMELQTMPYGGRAFAVRDPEGYQWSFGEYNPWTTSGTASATEDASKGA